MSLQLMLICANKNWIIFVCPFNDAAINGVLLNAEHILKILYTVVFISGYPFNFSNQEALSEKMISNLCFISYNIYKHTILFFILIRILSENTVTTKLIPYRGIGL